MRGKAIDFGSASSAVRITPAHAGKRLPFMWIWTATKDHPRTCGEKQCRDFEAAFFLGSPPHMRGKAPVFGFDCVCLRITPAHAGKRILLFRPCVNTQDHPRTCGEKFVIRVPFVFGVGSPPHMRGKGSATRLRIARSRITPAHAGKSDDRAENALGAQDHPRTCGEKGDHQRRAVLHQGSPPHMRGKGKRTKKIDTITRITPAHAGKSPVATGGPFFCGDHPRTCGEKSTAAQSLAKPSGSPPHMRGKD